MGMNARERMSQNNKISETEQMPATGTILADTFKSLTLEVTDYKEIYEIEHVIIETFKLAVAGCRSGCCAWATGGEGCAAPCCRRRRAGGAAAGEPSSGPR